MTVSVATPQETTLRRLLWQKPSIWDPIDAMEGSGGKDVYGSDRSTDTSPGSLMLAIIDRLYDAVMEVEENLPALNT